MPLLKAVGLLSVIYFVAALQEDSNSTGVIVFPDEDVGDRNIIKVPLKPCPDGQQRIGGICRLVFSNPGRSEN
ncbi:unnamed protein product [Nezara viridula]|uniref:Neuropeptide n=1 Tax=Nezara viridula TaxID=85310 RepID=A0A9P0MUC9_NEZVI|nr:unnamed protein product [Nezara viridula]